MLKCLNILFKKRLVTETYESDVRSPKSGEVRSKSALNDHISKSPDVNYINLSMPNKNASKNYKN